MDASKTGLSAESQMPLSTHQAPDPLRKQPSDSPGPDHAGGFGRGLDLPHLRVLERPGLKSIMRLCRSDVLLG